MSRLEEKLKELGYEYNRATEWYCKEQIRITIYKNKIIEKGCCVSIKQQIIKDRNDILSLIDSINDYSRQLLIMQKDLEILKGVENER